MKFAKLARIGLMSTLAIAMTTEAFAVEATPITELNIRTGPGKQFAVLDTLYRGEVVDVAECQANGWCMVYRNGPDGWVSARYLTQVSAGDLPPVVDDYPPEPVYPNYPPRRNYPPQQNYPPPQPDTSASDADAAAGLAFLAILGLSAAVIAGGIAQDNNPPHQPNGQVCQPGFRWSMRAHHCVAN
ncbi:MAG: SH3 domain-containing protein [Alphaproteobacteria bacterium]|nr:SH3 domain-containing protein [Alphaproteobacteria bacterium]